MAETITDRRPPRAPTRSEWIWAAILGVTTFGILAATEGTVGFVRDEGFYFHAGSTYADWYRKLVTEPSHALTRASIDGHFGENSEHPALMKTLFGLSHLLFTEKLHLVRDAAGFRIPAWLATALLVAVMYLFIAARVSHRAGVFAAAAWVLTPRQLFNSTLACFDVPIAAFWLATVYAYWRSRGSRRWGILSGVFLGLAIAAKEPGFFLPPLLLFHYAVTRLLPAWKEGRAAAVIRDFPRAFLYMAVLAPVIFFAVWPYLWFDTVPRFAGLVGFHTNHVNYPWQYMGRLLMDPPFPMDYPFVLTALTVPVSIVALLTAGLGTRLFTLGRSLKQGFAGVDEGDLLVLLNAVFPMALIAMPWIPHFGGVKHWLHAMPFLLLLAGESLERVAAVVLAWVPRLGASAFGATAGLILIPALIGSVHIHPYGTSFYNELVGGSPGAATIGFQRQFWANNVTGVLPWLNQNAPPGARVWFQEVPGDSYLAYRANQMLRPDIQYAGSANDSLIAAYQYMQEFRDQEFQVWTAYGTAKPVTGLYLDEVPNIIVYRRP